MTDILIKSFNRPYYLERAIQSIMTNVEGAYRIQVLDDGTPEVYLEKLLEKYPDIQIRRSNQYGKKLKAIEKNLKQGEDIDGFQIPTELWRQAVRDAGPYVLVTEDDVWFTSEVNLTELTQNMADKGIELLKLGWLGMVEDERYLDIQELNSEINRTIPKNLFTGDEWLMTLFMYNRLKFFTLMYRLKLVNRYIRHKYWILNSIMMGLYNKDYWLHIWKDADGKVDELQQLRNAASWYHRRKKNLNLLARTKTEKLKTTFQSSATGSYHPYGLDFDVNYFNHLMNKAWLEGRLDPMQNYPKDFSLEYFESFFDEKINKDAFRKWVGKFKDQYRYLGAETD